MRLAHVLVCHSTDPTKAIESIPHGPDALWYVFLHGNDPRIEATVERLISAREGNIFPFKINRGLARSWNDGLHLGLEAGCEAVLLLNDDLFFYEGSYQKFVETIGSVRNISKNISYVTPLGLETGTSAHAGQVLPQQFACCAILPEVVHRIGYFDENFMPAYYEDLDYDRRAALAGMTIHIDQRVLVEHERSSTRRSMSLEDQQRASSDFNANRMYFEAKWGSDAHWQFPFDQSDVGLSIPYSSRRSPYGVGRDRQPG